MYDFIGLPKTETAELAKLRNRSIVSRPFPRGGWGLGMHETTFLQIMLHSMLFC